MRRPERVGVVGAGMLGLATAWHLQDRGVQVTVIDRKGVAAGASWGNAGWVTPALVAPLPDPAILRYGLSAVVRRSSPVYLPPQFDLGLLAFLGRFMRNSTMRRWQVGMRALADLSRGEADAFDALASRRWADGAVHRSSIFACADRSEQLSGLLVELAHVRELGVQVRHSTLTPLEARELVPTLTDAVGAVLRIEDQRFIDPGRLLAGLASDVCARGGQVRESVTAVDIDAGAEDVSVLTATGDRLRFDAVVVATGTWLGQLTRKFGVRTRVQAGRGYSFSARAKALPAGPLYLPALRVACTPLGDRLRIAGMMEFCPPEAPLDERRVRTIAESVRPYLSDVDLDGRTDTWVGSRPCTADGLPLIGPTSSGRVWVAGGHGMWGITLGAVTGRALAHAMTGDPRPELVPFHPLRTS
ncbi:NAD(P)/FAD-dependent oxidoreductase [Spirillospora sp. NPDC048823]|uniref:NAD(P)/FAD-dependent oxidoreductase n=1 Tax=unclassified Spirillospora TaxID=2642701 RepID=UPI00371629E5